MRILILSLGSLLFSVFSFGQNRVIGLNETKITQLIFEEPVTSVKGGYIPEDFAVKTEDNVVYIQPMGEFTQTNLNIITGNKYFTFTLNYAPEETVFNHIISRSEAIFVRDSNKEESAPSNTTIDRKETLPKAKELTNKCSAILESKPFIFSGNGIKSQKISAYIKGVYVDETYIYFRMEYSNEGNINYDIDFTAFYTENKKSRKITSIDKVQFMPVYVSEDFTLLKAYERKEIVFCFEKFTISPNKRLYIDLVEKSGDRNIQIFVLPEFILKAKRI